MEEEIEEGSKIWFQSKLEEINPNNIRPIQTENKKMAELFADSTSGSKKEDAHLAYKLVEDSVDVCYLYRRKEPDTWADKYTDDLCTIPGLIFAEYSKIILPLLKERTVDAICLLEFKPSELNNLLKDTELSDAFFHTFTQKRTYEKSVEFVRYFEIYFNNNKKKFIDEIKNISDNAESIKSTCQNFGTKFLKQPAPTQSNEGIISEGSVDSEYSEDNNDLCEQTASLVAQVRYFKIPVESGWVKDDESIFKAGKPLGGGRIYQLPNGKHNWLNNLSWLLAHIHKANPFIVFSEVTKNAMSRKTSTHKGELSGFAREIALLTKLNYQFVIENSTVKLVPPQDKNAINNLHVKEVYLSDEEVTEFYGKAVKSYEKLKEKISENIEISHTSKKRPLELYKQGEQQATSKKPRLDPAVTGINSYGPIFVNTSSSVSSSSAEEDNLGNTKKTSSRSTNT